VRFWRSNLGADVDDELQFHLQERIDALVAHGLTPAKAAEEARRSLGDIDALKQTCLALAQATEHERRRTEMLGVLRQDVSYALRTMGANPAFSLAIALTLALGIGATTAIFSVVNAVLLRPMPYDNANRIVFPLERFGELTGNASVGHFFDWTEQSQSFEVTAAGQGASYVIGDGEPTRLRGLRVTPSFFQVLHMRPHAGRYFLPGETDESQVVVLSYPLWQTRFAGDPAILGKQLTLNGKKYTVVGITPRDFTLSDVDTQLWTPITFAPAQRTNYGAHFLFVSAMLKPGVTIAQAQRDLERVTEGIRRRLPGEMKDRGVTVQSFNELFIGSYEKQLWVLLGAVVFVLLIGCANIASLLLARAASRRKEIAIRTALGGSRRRLVAQLLTESLVLALAGGAAGIGVAKLGVRALINSAPNGVPRLTQTGLQPEVLLFALTATIVCGLLFGLAPALRATRIALQAELREGGRGSGLVVRDRVRAALIVTEIGVAVVLLVASGLFIRSAIRLQQIPLGFDPDGVTMMRVSLPPAAYQDPVAVTAAFQRIVDEVSRIPGVERAGANTRVPMWGGSIDMGITVEGRAPDPKRTLTGHVRLSTAGFLETLRSPLLRGRQLSQADLAPAAPWVVVVNETFARQVFGDENPIGKRVSGWTKEKDTPEWREIVGVVGDMRSFGRDNETPPEMYIPMTQAPNGAWDAFGRQMTVIVRTTPGASVGVPLRQAVTAVDRMIPVFNLQTMSYVLSNATAQRRFGTMLLSLLGITGLVLSAIGIYGVIAFFVAQRTHEIGVRIALGATARSVMQMVVGQALVLALIGIVVGAVAAFWATRVLETMLFQVGARDPATYAAAAATLVLVAFAAALIPARRATRVDPLRAMTAEG
jgi:predicted permease